jgi:hypothetical protein
VRVFPCTVIPCREYIFFAVYGVRDWFSSADSGPSHWCRNPGSNFTYLYVFLTWQNFHRG